MGKEAETAVFRHSANACATVDGALSYFDSLVELVPPQFYFKPKVDEDAWKKKKNKYGTNKVTAAPKRKTNRFDPSEQLSNVERQKKTAEEESASPSKRQGTKVQKKRSRAQAEAAGEPETADQALPSRTSDPVELRRRLHDRLQHFQQKRQASEAADTPSKKVGKNEKKKRKNPPSKPDDKGKHGDDSQRSTKRARKQDSEPKEAVKSRADADLAQAIAIDDGESLQYGRFDFAGGNPKLEEAFRKRNAKKKNRNKVDKQALLEEAENTKMQLDKLKGTAKGQELEQQVRMDAALKRAQGEKVLDDPKLLRKSIKREEKRKEKSRKQWNQRIEAQLEDQKKKQQLRQQRLKNREAPKPAPEAGTDGSSVKRGRAGFEGKKSGFLNDKSKQGSKSSENASAGGKHAKGSPGAPKGGRASR